jgi:hypothetical protein
MSDELAGRLRWMDRTVAAEREITRLFKKNMARKTVPNARDR